MSQASNKSSLLAEEIDLLVRHFGVKRVRAAVSKITVEAGGEAGLRQVPGRDASGGRKPIRANGTNAIDPIRQVDPGKYALLSEFLTSLKDRRLLPEAQDIRYFAQEIGLKDIRGKSREDMIPKLMRFLIERPIEKLRADIEEASNISEQQRRMGFSVLTDKLLSTR